ncbi:anti-sigma factor [Streptomyces rubellomurinus]|uniref:Regulator of SigK n=1 Tax=Streptomyces rubellomurinus (strain ATCC 31215) TaxID=359131 RepID=A0A0F2T488_STRR3|nr:anti-sigma factor [Streptomyces rubellomurinus]KJS58029.1 hypothetical protein VM95_35875 [Streptomyces rubellomurinus]
MTIAADLHTFTGAYALHALDAAQSEAFERHLLQCEACAVEVEEFRTTMARLGSAEAVVVPPEMKARTLAATSTIRQLAPLTSDSDRDGGSRSKSARRWPRFALAASIAATAALGGIAIEQHQAARQATIRADQLHSEQARLSALLTAPDTRTATGRTGAGVGTIVWSQSRGEVGFLAQGLPALASGKTYQLWFNDAGTMRPAGLLPSSSGSLVLTGQIHSAVGVGLTVEPAGGSQHPSGQPVLLLPLR